MLNKILTFLCAICLFGASVTGCGDKGNRVVEQPDLQQLEAKKQEFADFQKKMAEQSKLPGQK